MDGRRRSWNPAPLSRCLGRPKTEYTRRLLEASNLAPTGTRTPPHPAAQRPDPDQCGQAVRIRAAPGASRPWTSISLELKQGEILGVLGQSGSGKSTLARAIVGLEGISSGTISRALSGTGDASPTAVQLVFQEPHDSFDPRMTLRASLEAPLALAQDSQRGTHPAARPTPWKRWSWILACWTGARANAQAGSCSGSPSRGRCLMEPEVLICDEATSALDALTQRTILDLLQRLHRDRALSLMIITHDMDVVRHMCQRVAVLYQGRLVELTDTDRFFADPQHQHSQDLVSAAIPCRGLHLKKIRAALQVN